MTAETLTDFAHSALDRVGTPLSELGHGRVPRIDLPAFGPRPGACSCWHPQEAHGALCVEAGCACGGEFTRPVYSWLTLALAVLRGGRW